MIPERNGMGTTLTGAVVREDAVLVVQVGDSRCYLIRNDGMSQVTEDHSWVQEQVSRGAMTLEEAELSPFRNVITRSLGAAPEVEPELFAVKLEPGDRFILCSDGLNGMMSDAELFDLAREGSASVAAWNLVERAVENGGKDNVTVLVLAVQAIEPWEEGTGRRGDGATGTARNERKGGERVDAGAEREGADASHRAQSDGESDRPIAPSPRPPVAPPSPRGVKSFVKGLLGR